MTVGVQSGFWKGIQALTEDGRNGLVRIFALISFVVLINGASSEDYVEAEGKRFWPD